MQCKQCSSAEVVAVDSQLPSTTPPEINEELLIATTVSEIQPTSGESLITTTVSETQPASGELLISTTVSKTQPASGESLITTIVSETQPVSGESLTAATVPETQPASDILIVAQIESPVCASGPQTSDLPDPTLAEDISPKLAPTNALTNGHDCLSLSTPPVSTPPSLNAPVMSATTSGALANRRKSIQRKYDESTLTTTFLNPLFSHSNTRPHLDMRTIPEIGPPFISPVDFYHSKSHTVCECTDLQFIYHISLGEKKTLKH